MRKKQVIIIAERGSAQKMCEADSLLNMYSHYSDKIREFNNFNRIVNNVSGYQTNSNISTDIPVNREMFDKLYQGALLLKLPIDMTYNFDNELWFLTIKYRNTELCFTNSDN